MPSSVHLPSGMLALSVLTALSYNPLVSAIPVPNAYINFAGAGDNFTARQATFRVPDRSTTASVTNSLRRYEIHLAKMIEVTNWFCRYQERDYIVYWNYEVNNGKTFMGNIPLSCQNARQIVAIVGLGPAERVILHNRGRANRAMIPTLNLTGRNGNRFIKIVAQIKPECIEITPPVCPGDPLSQEPTPR